MVCPQCRTEYRNVFYTLCSVCDVPLVETQPQAANGPGLEVTWQRTLTIWWSWCWRGIVWGTVAVTGSSVIIGTPLRLMGGSELGMVGGAVAGWVGGMIMSVWVLRTVLTKQYREFAVVLLPRTSAPQGQQ